MKKILFAFVALFMFSACNQDELNRLKGQVETLQKENASLKSQVAELSETEQNKFNKAVDLFNSSKKATDYRKAEEAFNAFAAKYPASQYLEQAQTKQSEAKTKAEQLEWIDEQRESIKTSMANKDWDAASKTVYLIRKVISKEEYDGYVKKIYEEKNKPIQTTIPSLLRKGLSMYLKRVEIVGEYGGIDASIDLLLLRDKGSTICIQYGNADNVNDIINGENLWATFRVIGKVGVYTNTGDIFVQAEKIERIK